jgi:ABC-type siderophore export system fused ATPase/permease subunit
MNLYWFVPVRSWLTAVSAVIAGLAAGAFGAALIAVINTALHSTESSRVALAAGFFGLVGVEPSRMRLPGFY